MQEASRGAPGPARGLRVEGYTPPPDVSAAVERILAEARIEVGGVEYMIDARDGGLYYYDVDALANFVADAPNVAGFDPMPRLGDYLVAEAEAALGGEGGGLMRFGYWMPDFGGWLRKVDDEGMEASWEYVRRLAQRSERIGFDLALVADHLMPLVGVSAVR